MANICDFFKTQFVAPTADWRMANREYFFLLVPISTRTWDIIYNHMYTYIYIYTCIYIYVCVCVLKKHLVIPINYIKYLTNNGYHMNKSCQPGIHSHPCWSLFLLNEMTQNLVGGIPTPLKNMSSSVGVTIPNIWKKVQKCSKPPTRNG